MTNKELIQNFYNDFFNMHKIEAANLYVREDYIQHNPGLTHGREALKEGFAKKFESDPTFKLEINMMIAEDDMVAVYLKNVDPKGNTKCRIVDIYRIQDGQLAEHWDVLQPVTK